ncbi:MAG TPA: hypothetical protein VFH39_03565 [Candidatus Saccharimonadales bacterium]|nr:hypothetical protein [Candidatus Saccharimonadales bacterium]
MPGFEMRWGHGMDDAALRDAMRPVFRQGLNIAEERLEDVGLPLDETKRAVFHKVLCGYPYYAQTTTAKTAHFYFNIRELKKGIDVGLLGEVAGHEGAHMWRRQVALVRTLGDKAVDEGLGYHAPLASRHPLRSLHSPPDAIVRKIHRLPKREVRAMSQRFAEVIDEPLVADSAVVRRWERPYKDMVLSTFEVVGIAAVAARLDAGDAIANLMRLTTKQVLGIE